MKKKTVRQFRILIPVFLMNALCGLHFTWFAVNYEFFQSSSNDLFLTETDSSLMTSMIHLGRMIAPMINLLFAEEFGRKCIMIFSLFISLTGSIAMIYTRDIIILECVRILIGYSIGTIDGVAVLYIGEVSSKKNRGIFICLYLTTFYVGILTGYILGICVTYKMHNIILTLTSAVIMLHCFDVIESPYFFLLRKDKKTALKHIRWLQDINEKQSEQELEEISRNAGIPMKISEFLTIIKTPEAYKSYTIVLVLGFVSSIISITMFTNANIIFPTSELVSSNQFAILFCAISLFASLLSSIVVDRLGRRLLFIFGFSILSISFGIIAILFYVKEKSFVYVPYFQWIIFILITISFVVYNIAVCAPALAVRSEIFPTNFRIFGSNSTVVLNSLTNFIYSFLFLRIIEWYGMYANFFIYTFCSVANLLLVYCMLPETKGKTLYEIQRMLQKT